MPGQRIAELRRNIGEQTSQVRGKPAEVVENVAPELPDMNIGGGQGAGAVGAGILTLLEDTVGVPFGSSTDIVNIEEDGTDLIYTVDVNSPTENIAKARAAIDSGTGFTTYLTDEFDIDSAEVVSTRVMRDTYRVEVRITP